jgi:hypothetical protein
MLSGTDEPECPRRQRLIPSGRLGVVGNADATIRRPLAILTWADDAPDRQATKVLGRATIHLTVTGAAPAGRELFATARQATVGARGVTDWANSIAVN